MSEGQQVPPALVEAICDLLWRVTPCGTDDEGNVTRYLVSAGTVHRLVGQAHAAEILAVLRVPELADEDYRDRVREAAHNDAASAQPTASGTESDHG